MNFIKTNWMGILFCLAVAVPAAILGKLLPVIGGPVFGILFGMILALIIKKRDRLDKGVSFTSKKILQYAVILLGFGMNLKVVMETGKQSLPIIICTISTSLIVAYFLHKALKMPSKISTLIGVGSSICGGSAVAATAPVIDADEEEVAQAISVIFLFNILAALIFPALGNAIGFATDSGEAFGIFAGTAVNDTSSVTAAASTWDSMHNLGSQTLDKAVTVKLTRTLAIIPITLVLAFYRLKKAEKEAAKAVAAGAAGTDNKAGGEITGASEGSSLAGAEKNAAGKVSMKKVFPFFILFFIAASLITTIAVSFGVPVEAFNPLKELSKFFIIMAMSAIGFNTNIVKLLKSGLKPVILGFACWIGITAVTLCMQHFMNIL